MVEKFQLTNKTTRDVFNHPIFRLTLAHNVVLQTQVGQLK